MVIWGFLIMALCFGCHGAAEAGQRRAALLNAGLPGEDPSLASLVKAEIQKAGYTVEEIGAGQLCDYVELLQQNYDLLVLPTAGILPAQSTTSINNYLKSGGHIIALGSPLWQRSLIKLGSRWLTRDEYQTDNAGKLPESVVFHFDVNDLQGWSRSSNQMEIPTRNETVPEGPGAGQRALHTIIPDMANFDTFNSPELKQPFPAGHTLTVLSAKGDGRTPQLAVEWQERDGSRWIAVIALTPQWRRYVLTPTDFHYWQSTPARGGRGDQFKPENATRFSVGLAYSHTGGTPGEHEYWVGPVGTAPLTEQYRNVVAMFAPPALDTLSPSYKLFDVNGTDSLLVSDGQFIVSEAKLPSSAIIRSPHPRPSGGGFNKGRDWRWVSLIESRTAKGEWRGSPASLYIHASGPFKGGIWASFGIGQPEWYKTPPALGLVRQIAERMKNGTFILDGGANFYTYFSGQKVDLGITAFNVDRDFNSNVTARVTVRQGNLAKPVFTHEWKVNIAPGQTEQVKHSWKPAHWPKGGFTVTAELLQDGRVTDRVSHKIYLWLPKEAKEFVTVQDGEFILNGRRWRANGVNYMPSSGIGTEDGEYFERQILRSCRNRS